MESQLTFKYSSFFIKSGLLISVSTLVLLLFSFYFEYKVFITIDNLGTNELYFIYYLQRILLFIGAALRIGFWVLMAWYFSNHLLDKSVKIFYAIIVFEAFFYFTQNEMLNNMLESEIMMTLFAYFKKVVIEFLLFIFYFFAGMKLRKLKEFQILGWFVQLVLAPSLLVHIYINWDFTFFTPCIYNLMVIVTSIVFVTTFVSLKRGHLKT